MAAADVALAAAPADVVRLPAELIRHMHLMISSHACTTCKKRHATKLPNVLCTNFFWPAMGRFQQIMGTQLLHATEQLFLAQQVGMKCCAKKALVC